MGAANHRSHMLIYNLLSHGEGGIAMTFRSRNTVPQPTSLDCPECGSTRYRYYNRRIQCTNCGWEYGGDPGNKYGASRTLAQDGKKRDSKFEASVADSLLLRKRGRDIKGYDSQYVVVMDIYRSDGIFAFSVKHKVDFRVHHNDGSFELLEAKGVETLDYKWRRRLLEELWLPLHKDHIYTVVKQRGR